MLREFKFKRKKQSVWYVNFQINRFFSFYRFFFFVLSFFAKKHRAYSIVLSFYRFIVFFFVLHISFYRCKLPNQSLLFLFSFNRLSFLPKNVISFFGKKHRVNSIFLSFYLFTVLSFLRLIVYRCKENIFFSIVLSLYRFFASSFYHCKNIVLSM